MSSHSYKLERLTLVDANRQFPQVCKLSPRPPTSGQEERVMIGS